MTIRETYRVFRVSQATPTRVSVPCTYLSCSLSGQGGQGGQGQKQGTWHLPRSAAQGHGDGSSSLAPGLRSPVSETLGGSYTKNMHAHLPPVRALVQR